MKERLKGMGKTFRPSINGVSIAGVKTFMGQDGYGLSCTVYLNGKKAGVYTDTADGNLFGEFYGDRKPLDELVKKMPKRPIGDLMTEVELEDLVNDLYNLNEEYKIWKRYNSKGGYSIGIVYDKASGRNVCMAFGPGVGLPKMNESLKAKAVGMERPEYRFYTKESDFTRESWA